MNYKHGKKHTKIYGIWCAMVARCTNPAVKSYPRYGGRGISVSDDWLSFTSFYRDMGDPPAGFTLDRVDNDKGYSIDNCRWASRSTQSINRRSTKLYKAGEQEKSLSEWSAETGISIGTLWNRIKIGWSVSDAIRTPLKSNKANRNSFGAKHNVRWTETHWLDK